MESFRKSCKRAARTITGDYRDATELLNKFREKWIDKNRRKAVAELFLKGI